ncbi:MAG TPA: hypothetical protein VHX86_14265 [Tepidisphaeraceae bacterium]|jgi:hypothetical protein|nr:hypothetical protein [Tepidisphaeraceae bacterium]
MAYADDESLFLMHPHTEKKPPGLFGILYLLRRDILICMGLNPNDGTEIISAGPDTPSAPLWPGAMAVMAGVDLVAKFLEGKDNTSVGYRFRKFLEQCFKLASQSDREIIYQLRNSLLHSFGLYSEDSTGRIYRFSLRQDGPLITSPTNPSDSTDRYVINIRRLHQDFEKAVVEYQTQLRTGPQANELQRNFARMFPNYGVIEIGPLPPPATSDKQPGQPVAPQLRPLPSTTATLNLSSTYPR